MNRVAECADGDDVVGRSCVRPNEKQRYENAPGQDSTYSNVPMRDQA